MTERDLIIIGSLLSRIGAFWQRTGAESQLNNSSRNSQLPAHLLWSQVFLERYVAPHFSAQSAQLKTLYQDNKTLEMIMAADRLAAGITSDKSIYAKDDLSTYRLAVVTEQIAISEDNIKQRKDRRANYYYQLVPLSITEDIFPELIKDTPARDRLQQQYRALWQLFINEYQKLPWDNFIAYLDSLTYLLNKYCWAVPSITLNQSAISLYDHSRVSAALTHCIYQVAQSTNSDNSEREFLLIEGDISGIQKFIYSPAFNGQEIQQGIARRLRGRSFYLNLMLKTLADYLVTELDLYQVNIIWAIGGHFLLIAPNTTEIQDRLKQAKATITQWIWREYRGALGITIADYAANRAEMLDFSSLRNELGKRAAILKLQQFAAPLNFQITSDDQAWQNSWVLNMQTDICRDTGRDLNDGDVEISQAYHASTDNDDNGTVRSAQSLLFDAIGRVLINTHSIQLRRNREWQLDNIKPARLPRNADEAKRLRQASKNILIEFAQLDRCWLLSDYQAPQEGAHLSLRIVDNKNNQIDFLSDKSRAQQIGQGFEFFANAVKTKEKDGHTVLMELNELADNASGGNFLGVLRMDVDNLGLIFSNGLPEKTRSLARIANLSRMLDQFFSGYLNKLVSDNYLYTTYAGGDDLFIVGAWDQVVELAENIRQQFSRYCADNRDIHISGGIALCKGKYPIGHAALEAGHLLDSKAKAPASYLQDDSEKDALAFLERKVPWQRWFQLRRLGDDLIAEMNAGNVSRSFIYNLLDLYRNYIDPLRDRAVDQPKMQLVWVPRFLYSLARNIDDAQLRNRLQNEIPQHKEYLSVLAGYVLLKTRGKDHGSNRESQFNHTAQQEIL